MQGTVTRIQAGGGTINSPGHGNVPFSFADLARGLRVRQNQQVEFELGPDGQGGQKAINIRLGSRAAAGGSNQAFGLTWKFGESQASPQSRTVPLWITLKRGDKAASGIEVKLYVNGTQHFYPANDANPQSTDATGTVYFAIGLTPDVTECDILVEAGGKAFTANWKLPEPELTVKESDGPGWKTLLVVYGQGKDIVPATFEVWPINGCQLAVREAGQTAWVTQPGNINVPSTGRCVIQVRIEQLLPGAGGEHIFISVQGKTVSSSPIYISRHQ